MRNFALILSTRGHYPAVPEGRVNAIPVGLNERTPTLLALAAKKMKQAGVPWKSHFAALKNDGYHYDSCLDALSKYDGEYAEPIFHPTTPDRKIKKREDFKMLRLAYSTLLIVPPNLLVQWQDELAKHTHTDSLDVLVIDDGSKDQTVALLQQNPGLYDRLIVQPRNGGKGAAVLAGRKAATGDYILFQDADLEYSPTEYAALVFPNNPPSFASVSRCASASPTTRATGWR